MNFLLDTHVFLWCVTAPHLLSARGGQVCGDPSNRLLLSVVNVWELVIKVGVGKLKLDDPVTDIVDYLLDRGNVTILGVELAHALRVGTLPSLHKDPFDRMLVAQALAEDAVLLTADPLVRRYPVPTDW